MLNNVNLITLNSVDFNKAYMYLFKCLAKLRLEISGTNSIPPCFSGLAWMSVSSFIDSEGIAVQKELVWLL